jgi:hypothetical protein
MSGQNAKGKSKYESPVLVPLGGMAKGTGACTTGSSYAGVCVYNPGGNAPYTEPGNCTAGGLPNGYCSAGTTATINGAAYCSSSGVTASDYCTAGNCAPGPTGYCTSSGMDAGAACTTSGTVAGGACSSGAAGL